MTFGLAQFESGAAAQAADALRGDGVVVLRQLWPESLIGALNASLRKLVPGAFDMNAPRPEDVWVVGHRRINGLVPVAGKMADCIDLLLQPTLLALLDKALGDGWVYESFGVISSFPGATVQKLHADSQDLYGDPAFAGKLPTFALTISIPLLAVNAANGSTEFLPGTHRAEVGTTPRSAEFATSWLAPGDCMIWDFMVSHRGQPNNSDVARPMIYITACRKFWQDSTNFVPDARKFVVDRAVMSTISPDRARHFLRAKPMPGARSALQTANRLVRWYAPGFHRALRRLARRPERPL